MTNEPSCETEYDFTLVLESPGEVTDEVEDALFEAGCDDATISLRFGRVYVTFSRSATSFKDAIISAIKDVRSANVGAVVLRIDQCDLVTQAEIARRINRTRQLVSQYILGQRGPGGFPGPVCNIIEGQPLWYWCEIASWLADNNLIKSEDLREAQDLSLINTVLEFENQKRMFPELANEVSRALS